jgi:DNA-binding MarR family transcriptional regulator
MSASGSRERSALIGRLTELGAIDATETALFQQAAAARYGLGISEMKALDILMREGPQTAGALARKLNLTTGAVTGVIDRLERQAIADRRQDPTDRRRVVVEANLETLARGENVYLGIAAAYERLYGTYSLDQLRFLVDHMERGIDITREERAKVVAGARVARRPARNGASGRSP